MITTASINHGADPRPTLATLETPALILRGECDRFLPEVHQEYQDIFTNATLLIVDEVGHDVAQSPEYADILHAFLMEQPLLVALQRER